MVSMRILVLLIQGKEEHHARKSRCATYAERELYLGRVFTDKSRSKRLDGGSSFFFRRACGSCRWATWHVVLVCHRSYAIERGLCTPTSYCCGMEGLVPSRCKLCNGSSLAPWNAGCLIFSTLQPVEHVRVPVVAKRKKGICNAVHVPVVWWCCGAWMEEESRRCGNKHRGALLGVTVPERMLWIR